MKFKQAFLYTWLQTYDINSLALLIGTVLLALYFGFGYTAANIKFLQLVYFALPLIVWRQVITFWLQRFNIRYKMERGLLLAGRLISIIVTPIYLVAFIGVIMGKRIHFKVTPKGNKETNTVPIKIFIPQLILGTISLAGVIYGQITHHTARILIFWALVSVVLMYSSYLVPLLYSLIKNTWLMKPRSLKPISSIFQRRHTLDDLELNH
jgi:hypothetical protein